ncbi:unnamed protein product [Lactuca virosa]|uniref:Reverse transcriptase domain-containing protein n=1 Tax=Lactuca virosa TaxID=75947 RepID=A0AAU9NEC9_9ASTR|nr:unnamed protein product [Lactuca virosa]
MGASSKADRLKEVKVKPPDKSVAVQYVWTEVDVKDLVPPGVIDQSSATIYKARRKPSASGAVASGIGKAEWKMEGKAFRVKNRARKIVDGISPIDAKEYYTEEANEEETEDDSESVSAWESDSNSSIPGNDSNMKGLKDGGSGELKTIGVQVVSIPSGNTANLLKNWDGSKVNDELLSPSSELKSVTSEMIRVNPNIDVIDVNKPVCPDLVDDEVEKSKSNGDKKVISNEEFIPGVGFQFLNELKVETPKRKDLDSKLNQEMDVDMSNLNKQVNEEGDDSEDDGSSEEDGEDESSEDESSEDEEIVMEEEVNTKMSKEPSLKMKSGTVINSINMLPSILGDANSCKKVDGDSQGNLLNSYAGVLKGNRHKGKIDVKFIPGEKGKEEGPVIIPIENLKKASIPYTNTLYGYMIDKKLAFPVIQQEVRRLWKNVGLEEIFMNSKGFFFFKFSDEQGMLSILEGSPWLMFNNMPLFLQRWRPGLKLTKNSHDKIPVWIKIFDLPLEVWSGENLCIIASKLGVPLAFDSFTEEMCLEHKGRNAYARILVEMAADKEWMRKIEVSTWDFVTNSAVVQSFDVEYAWMPSRCNHCKVYGHTDKVCLAALNEEKVVKNGDNGNNKRNKGKEMVNDDGFTEVVYKKVAGNNDGEGTSKSKEGHAQLYNQRYSGKNGNFNRGNNFRGNYGNRGGNGRGQNGNWNNKGVGHWNLEKNRRYEKFVNGQALVGNQGKMENKMQGNAIKDDNIKVGVNKSLENKTVSSDGCSIKNSFEILGRIDEEVMDRMEEDAKGGKVDGYQEGDCVDYSSDVVGIMNNKLDPSKFVGKGNVGNESNKMKNSMMVQGNSKSKDGISQAFEEKEVIDVIRSNNLGICAVVESHVKVLNLKNVCVKTFGQWDWVSNNSSCEAGTRIIVGWNPRLFDVMVISQSRQVIHCYVRFCDSNYSMYLSFIYAASNYLERRLLWDNLKKHSLVVKKEAWGILGDFNVALKPSEYSEGCSKTPKGVDDFIDCINFIEVEDLNSSGFQFTWNKTPAGNKGLLKKLDRVMANLKFVSDHPLAHAVFKPYRVSDHCPAILNVPVGKLRWKPSFRFANFITEKVEFLPLVKEVWDANIEEKLLFQRSKINWLQEGDNNTKFFHRVVKSRGNRNRILMVIDEDGRWVSGKAMKDKFVTHFNKFLGCKDVTEFSCLNDGFFHNKLDSRVAANMIRVVTDEEIKVAMFDIDENRAPGPDGYSSKFFKSSWNIVGPEVCKAVREFFWTGKLLKGINATRIVLVPKVEFPRKVSDFRPIACCNTLYKCISKIIVNRIRNSLGDIVSKNQSAFIPGRSIVDNILLAQELMVGYKNKRGVPKCTIKIDIQKAYDTVDWNFLSRILQGFGFHTIMIQWIMACVSTPWFMLNFNGEDHGYFEGKRGLRQGDPLSPYLFTIVMEVFNIILLKKIEAGQNFKFHSKCMSLKITHLCFADDLLVFSYGNGNSARVIRDALDEFKKVSGLKALSFAGRLQLINSVLTSIHVYWASIFKIPIATIKEIEKLCRSFLWANGEVVKGKAKVKWNDICKPKIYGGLGVKNLRKWNDALLAKHVWNVINSKNSLWVQWVKSNYIGNRNFWDILQKKSMSWTWKRFLEVRKIVRPHVVSCVGNGMNTSLWHDWWHPIGILCSIISRRDWVSNGFSDSSLVSDVLVYDCYTWPVEWVNIFPGLKDAPMFCIEPNLRDVAGWRDKKGICKQFSCKQVWWDINNFEDQVPWHDIVWYGNCIPRNSFILWMAILNRLKTQDRVRGWEVSGNLLCPFCAVTPDSHVHLFFKCDYSQLIWRYFCNKMGLNLFMDDWNELIMKLCSLFKRNSGENLVNKCVFASCVAHIWKERNSRLFSNRRNSYKGLIACIESEIHLMLLGLRKKAKMVNDKVFKAWGISGMEKV